MEIEGKIVQELPLEEGISKMGKPWKKKGWVLETLGQYPRTVKFDVFGERVDSISFEVGQLYSVSVDVESREWNGRWYTDLRAFNSRPLASPQGAAPFQQGAAPFQQTPQPQPQAPAFGPAPAVDINFTETDSSEDLPF